MRSLAFARCLLLMNTQKEKESERPNALSGNGVMLPPLVATFGNIMTMIGMDKNVKMFTTLTNPNVVPSGVSIICDFQFKCSVI